MRNIKNLIKLKCLLCVFVSSAFPVVSSQDDQPDTAKIALSTRSDVDSGPLCGLYALYAAATIAENDVQMSTLFSGKYLAPSQHGSRVQDLLKAASDHSIPAYAIYGIDADSLVQNGKPALMLLDERSSGLGLGHWVLLLGSSGSDYLVFDSSFGVHAWSGAELLSGWGGTAIVVDRSNSRPTIFLDNALKRLTWLGVPVALASPQSSERV